MTGGPPFLLPPHPSLGAFVQRYWFWNSDHPQQPRFLHPDGGSGLIFAWGGLSLGGTSASGVVVAPWELGPRSLAPAPGARLVGVRFWPGGAYPFFGRFGPPEDMVRDLEGLGERVCKAAPFDAARELDGWLGRLLVHQRSAYLGPAVEAIRAAGGRLRLGTLEARLGISERHLERVFRDQVGWSPKQLARVVRVRTTKVRLGREPLVSLTDLALQMGYSDQAHFSREFQNLIGLTPSAYRSLVRKIKIGS